MSELDLIEEFGRRWPNWVKNQVCVWDQPNEIWVGAAFEADTIQVMLVAVIRGRRSNRALREEFYAFDLAQQELIIAGVIRGNIDGYILPLTNMRRVVRSRPHAVINVCRENVEEGMNSLLRYGDPQRIGYFVRGLRDATRRTVTHIPDHFPKEQ